MSSPSARVYSTNVQLLSDVIMFLTSFLDDVGLNIMAEIAGVNHSNAAPKWARNIRKFMVQFVWNGYFNGTGLKLNIVVQVDESKFG